MAYYQVESFEQFGITSQLHELWIYSRIYIPRESEMLGICISCFGSQTFSLYFRLETTFGQKVHQVLIFSWGNTMISTLRLLQCILLQFYTVQKAVSVQTILFLSTTFKVLRQGQECQCHQSTEKSSKRKQMFLIHGGETFLKLQLHPQNTCRGTRNQWLKISRESLGPGGINAVLVNIKSVSISIQQI